MGTGSENERNPNLYIGMVAPDVFERLRGQVTEALLAWCGRRLADPAPQGQVCELIVGFKRADGKELKTVWRYGSRSLGPAREVRDFVVAAVQATAPWYARQRALSGRSNG